MTEPGAIPRVLCVTTQNVLTPCGELSYLRRRALELRQRWGIDTNFLAISDRRHVAQAREPISEHFPTEVLAVDLRRPWLLPHAVASVRARVMRKLREHSYRAVVLCGPFTVGLAPLIARVAPGVPVLGDFHGAAEDMLRVAAGRRGPRGALIRAMYAANEVCTKVGFPALDGLVSVSEALNAYLRKRYGASPGLPAFAVPSACDPELADDDTLRRWRAEARARYGFAASDIVWGYAGSTSPWQCLEQAYEMASRLRQEGQPVRLLLLVSDRAGLPPGAAEQPWVSVDTVPGAEVEPTLCAADYLLLLRDDSVVARVAFPTKFLEYLKCPAWVITTPHAGEVATVVATEDLGVVTDFDPEPVRRHLSEGHDPGASAARAARERVLRRYSFARTLAPIVERFGG